MEGEVELVLGDVVGAVPAGVVGVGAPTVGLPDVGVALLLVLLAPTSELVVPDGAGISLGAAPELQPAATNKAMTTAA